MRHIPAGAFTGGYNPDRWPWVAAALRIFSKRSTRTMFLAWGIQNGKTLMMRLAATYLMANDRANMVIYLDNQEKAKDFTLRYLRPIFQQVPEVRNALSSRDNEKSDIIDFADGSIIYNNSASTEKDLQSISTRYVFGDECWKWPQGAMKQSMGRTKAYEWTSKKLYVSQPGVVGDDFDKNYNMTDCREWHFKCPHCAHLQPWDWAYVRLPEDAKVGASWDHRKVEKGTTYECRECKKLLPDTNDTRYHANLGGDFIATRESQKDGWVGTHVSALASMSWGALAVDMLKAKEFSDEYGDESARKSFKQQYLALPWSEDGGSMVVTTEASDYKMDDDWADEAVLVTAGSKAKAVPRADAPASGGIPFRTAGVDVQQGHFWVVVRRWSVTGHSRLKAFANIDTWGNVEAFLAKHGVHKAMVIVDSGYDASNVYRETAKRGWKCGKGSASEDFAVTDKDGKTSRRFYSEKQSQIVPGIPQRAELIVWSNLGGKDLLHGLRSRKVFTFSKDATDEYVAQLNSEVRFRDPKTGKYGWRLPEGKKDNHALDCELLAMLAAVRWGVVGREAVESTIGPS